MTGASSPIADRGEPRSLLPVARRLYDEGKTPRQVLEAIYGVDLPVEAERLRAACEDDSIEVSCRWLFHPWALMRAPDAASGSISDWSRRVEMEAYGTDPEVLPLLTSGYPGAPLGEHLLGYRLDELRAGRSTVVGTRFPVDMRSTVRPMRVLGPSLLDVLHQCIAGYRDLVAARKRTPGMDYEKGDLDVIDGELRGVEELQRQLAAEVAI